MANWNTLKTAVADVINANGNQAITGQLLQNVLNNIITNVGENATFAGIATLDTNPGVPDGPVFYLATTAGTYPNFNGIEVQDGEAVILLWNNNAWSKKVTGFATQEKLSQLGSKVGGTFLSDTYFADANTVFNLALNANIPQGECCVTVQSVFGIGELGTIVFTDGINDVLREDIHYGVPTRIELPSSIARIRLYLSKSSVGEGGEVSVKIDYGLTHKITSNSEYISKVESKLDSIIKPKLLFIGNSLQQDAVAYVPLLLKELAPNLPFDLSIWYIGGATAKTHLEYFESNTPCSVFSRWTEKEDKWENSTATIEEALAYEPNIICVQDFFASVNTYGDEKLGYFNGVIDYIKNIYNKNCEFVSLFPAPYRPDENTLISQYEKQIVFLNRIYNGSPIEDVIPAGISIKDAIDYDTFKGMGDMGYMTNDYTHAQEGFPCMIQAYVVAQWILNKFGVSASIYNSEIQITSESELNKYAIPGKNGNLVTATDVQIRIGKNIAIKCVDKKFTQIYQRVSSLESYVSSLESENLLPTLEAYTSDEFTITPNEDGTYTLNGQLSENRYFYFYDNSKELMQGIQRGKKYRYSCSPFGASENAPVHGIIVYLANGEIIGFGGTEKSFDFTIPEDAIGIRIRLYISSTIVFSNAIISINLIPVKSFASMENDIASMENENLLPTLEPYTEDDFSITPNGDGTYTLNGQVTSEKYFYFYDSSKELMQGLQRGKKYRYTCNPFGFGENGPVHGVMIYLSNGEAVSFGGSDKSFDFVIPEDSVGIRIRMLISTLRKFSNATISLSLLAVKSFASIEGDIASIESDIASIESDNLLPIIENTINGVTISPNEDGSYTINGKSTDATRFYFYDNPNDLMQGLQTGKKYIFGLRENLSLTKAVQIYYNNGENEVLSTSYNEPLIFDIPHNAIGIRFRIYIGSATIFDNDTASFYLLPYKSISAVYETLNDKLWKKPYLPPPFLTIIDDDGFAKFKRLLLPLIESKQIPIASSVVGDCIMQAEEGDTTYMTWSDIKECQEAGAEILSHTYMNLSAEQVESMSEREIQFDYQKMKNLLHSHGIDSKGLVFVGASSRIDKCRAAAKKVYDYGFLAGSGGVNTIDNIQRYNLRRNSIEPTTTLEEMKALIDEVVNANTGWLIWMIHTSYGTFQQDTVNRISEAIDYAIELGLPIVTTECGVRYYLDRYDNMLP